MDSVVYLNYIFYSSTMSQEPQAGPSRSTESCLQYIKRKGGIVLLRAGYQFLKKKEYKTGSVIWECHLRRRNKCTGTITIKVCSFFFIFIFHAYTIGLDYR